MKKLILICIALFSAILLFKLNLSAKNTDRESIAYKHTIDNINSFLEKNNIYKSDLNIVIVTFKNEKLLRVFIGNKNKALMVYKTFPICAISGKLGPKIMEGDEQTPEGFYFIDRFNPYSNFLLSLGINYPNYSDKIRSNKLAPNHKLGGDIFIHGSCVSIGCMAMTDAVIEEIYTLAKLAKNAGQIKIPVYIFPMDFSNPKNLNFEKNEVYSEYKMYFPLWKKLKEGFEKLNSTANPLEVSFTKSGEYKFK